MAFLLNTDIAPSESKASDSSKKSSSVYGLGALVDGRSVPNINDFGFAEYRSWIALLISKICTAETCCLDPNAFLCKFRQ